MGNAGLKEIIDTKPDRRRLLRDTGPDNGER